MKLQLKRSNVLELGAAKEPTSAQMEYGELAVNYNDGDPALFIKDSADNIIRIAGAGNIGSGDTPSGPVPPSTGNEIGDIFFDTTLDALVYWDGTSWVELSDNENAAKIYVGTLAEINNDVLASTRRSGFLWWNTEDGTLYVWYEDGNTEQWVVAVPSGGSGGGASISSGPFLPNSGEVNELFFNTTDGRLYIYYDDGSSQQWIDASPDNVPDLSAYVLKTGDTMTGDLTAPVIKATDHMEGVYSSQVFTVAGVVGAQSVFFDIPTWCSKIEINHLDWRSTGSSLGVDVAYWQFLNSDNTQYLLNYAGSRYENQWGQGFIGNIVYANNTSAEVYFIGDAAPVAHGGTLTLHVEDTLQTNEVRFRCNFTATGNYQTAAGSSSSYMQQGIMVSASPNDRPAKLRLGSNQVITDNAFVGKIKFYA
jgi:hypothetical protein